MIKKRVKLRENSASTWSLHYCSIIVSNISECNLQILETKFCAMDFHAILECLAANEWPGMSLLR